MTRELSDRAEKLVQVPKTLSTTGSEVQPIQKPRHRKSQRNRPNALASITKPSQTETQIDQSQECQDRLHGIAIQIVWIRLVGWKTVQDTSEGFHRDFEELVDASSRGLTTKEKYFALENSHDVYNLNLEARILEFVAGLTAEEISRVVDKGGTWRWGMILRLKLQQYQCQKEPLCNEDGEPMDYEDKTSPDPSVREEKARFSLFLLLKIMRKLTKLISQAARMKHLTDNQLESLRWKMLYVERHFDRAISELYGTSSVALKLFDTAAEKWWDVPNDAKQEQHHNLTHSMEGTDDAELDQRSGLTRTTEELDGVKEERRENTSNAKMRPGLNFLVPITLSISVIPTIIGWYHASPVAGTANDSDFWQTITGCVLQLLSILTFIWPTSFHPRLYRLSWVLIRICAALSAICALVSIPLYLVCPTQWSVAAAFTGTVLQAVVQLQVINAI